MKKRILVISQYFYPEQFRINDMCIEWVKKGYEVTVLTGIPNYPHGKYFENYGLFKKRRELYKGINIIRIPLVPRGKNFVFLALNYLSFVVSGFFWSLFTKLKVDYVFIFEVSPMTQALPGVWYAQKNKIPCYIYVQDLWPENVESITGIKNKTFLGVIGKMVDYIYEKCTYIFTTSKSFAKAIESRNVSENKIKYWPQYAEDYYKPYDGINNLKEEKTEFSIVFAGNIGNAQGLDILPKAAKILKEKALVKKIKFTIVGDGRYKETLINLVKREGLEDMFVFIDRQPATAIPEILSKNDVALISLTADPLFSMTIPAKLQSYLACGIPILASASGETVQIIKEANAGVSCGVGNVDEFSEAIVLLSEKNGEELKKMGENARNYYLNNFDKDMLLGIMDEYFRFN